MEIPAFGRWLRLLVVAVIAAVMVTAVAFVVAELVGSNRSVDPLGEGVVDDFSDGPGLDERWTSYGAEFVVGDGAVRSDRVSDSAGFALIDAGRSSVVLTVDFDEVASGSGVVVRYADPRNYIKVVAVEELATWNVYVIDDGQATFIGSAGGFSLHEPPIRLEVITVGGVLDVFTDGIRRVSLPIEGTLEATSVGLFVDPEDDGRTAWSSAVVSPAVPGSSS